MDMISLPDWARAHAIPPNRAGLYAREGRLPGAEQRNEGRRSRWFVPRDAEPTSTEIVLDIDPSETDGMRVKRRALEVIRLVLLRPDHYTTADLAAETGDHLRAVQRTLRAAEGAGFRVLKRHGTYRIELGE